MEMKKAGSKASGFFLNSLVGRE
ncbi:hypothetical protein CNECB9_5430014 [Cupriavidus necator]|uniref:Uncharacterized protein n=1 Tax=Cupriavidus necator TaxID=106590 RepID=A0A1K0J250_CUPNE|nr:hypothetical protein CNECB9_5430014 [Cupriavidus necator]